MAYKPSNSVRIFDTSVAQDPSFFQGTFNTRHDNFNFDPMIPGYGFWFWTKVPSWLIKVYPDFVEMTQKYCIGVSAPGDIELQTAALNYGFANNEYQVATTISKGNTDLTLKFGKELQGSPFSRMFAYWITGIRDPETGIATYPAIHDLDYCAKNHTGEGLYVLTRPDANNLSKNNIEFAAYYTAILPKKFMLSQYTYELGGHDPVDVEMSFTTIFHTSPLVDEFAIEKLKEAYGFRTLEQFDPQDPAGGPGNIMDDNTQDDGSTIVGQPFA